MPAKYTVLEGDRRYKQIEWGSAALPPCQVDLAMTLMFPCDKAGEYDSPTTQGPWADLCAEHAVLCAPLNQQLGYHRIQKVRATDA